MDNIKWAATKSYITDHATKDGKFTLCGHRVTSWGEEFSMESAWSCINCVRIIRKEQDA